VVPVRFEVMKLALYIIGLVGSPTLKQLLHRYYVDDNFVHACKDRKTVILSQNNVNMIAESFPKVFMHWELHCNVYGVENNTVLATENTLHVDPKIRFIVVANLYMFFQEWQALSYSVTVQN